MAYGRVEIKKIKKKEFKERKANTRQSEGVERKLLEREGCDCIQM